MSPLSIPAVPSRREFLATSAAAAACALCPARCFAAAQPAAPSDLLPQVKPRLRLVYCHPDPRLQGWPYQGFDYEARKKQLTAWLEQACPNVEFLPATAESMEHSRQLLATGETVDGYIVYLLGIPSNAARPIAFSGRPCLLVDDHYGGTGQFLALYGEAVRKGLPVAGVTSSRFADLVEAVKAFECLKKVQASTLLNVSDRDPGDTPKVFSQTLGLSVHVLPSGELNRAYENAGGKEAQYWAKQWIARAEKVIEPSREEIERSGRMYLAMSELLRSHRAQGIAVDCLRLFYDGRLPAYPCLGFFQLNNDGLVGACEADLDSAATMLLMSYLAGRPGYISDPVIDTATNRVIYAHCVAPNKVFGPTGKVNPYHIRSHSEDRKGASIRSLLPVGEMTTTLKFLPRHKVVVFHQGRTVANIDEDRACRTKLAVEVRNARKLAADWAWGWHRVTVYGDWRIALETVSALAGFKLVEEG